MPDNRHHQSPMPPRGSTVPKLVVWSIAVGAALSTLGMAPSTTFTQPAFIVRGNASLGLSAIRSAFEYLIVGAVIVAPVWLFLALLRDRIGAH